MVFFVARQLRFISSNMSPLSTEREILWLRKSGCHTVKKYDIKMQ